MFLFVQLTDFDNKLIKNKKESDLMKNVQVELDGVIIPYCEEGGERWYPIRYITEKFLLKGATHLQSKDSYKEYIKIQVIDYTFKGTSPQETNCMNKDGWIKYLSECKLNKNKDNNKLIKHNIFCDYVGCNNKYPSFPNSLYISLV